MKTMNKAISFIKLLIFYSLLFALAFIMLFPFWFMFIGGFRTTPQIHSLQFTLLPEYGFTYLKNFYGLFAKTYYLRSLINTAFLAAVRTGANLFLASLAGYAFQKMYFVGKKQLFYFLLGTMMIPGTVTIIPLYVMMAKFHWIDTYLPLIVPGMVGAFGVFIMKQYMSAVPDEIIYSARIDGCGDFRTYISIALPMVQSGLIVYGIILFMGSWNDFLWPLIIINNPELYVVTIILKSLRGAYNQMDFGVVMAGSFLSALPMIILFIAFKERLLTGIMAGGLKG